MKRHGPTEGKAKAALRDALARRAGEARGEEITSTMRLEKLAEVWFTEQARLAAQGDKQLTTVDQYQVHYHRHIKKALGERQVQECTVAPIHKFLVKLAESSSANAVMCRKVLSGMLGYAVIHGALKVNPVRDVGRIKRKAQRPARALEASQVLDWLTKVDSNDEAKAADLPDLSRFLLATGLRIGEALAVSWREIDLNNGTVAIAWHMVYVQGQGIVRQPSTKGVDDDGNPVVLDLPPWGVAMLKERKRRFGLDAILGPLFPHPATGKYQGYREVGKVIRAVRGELGYKWLTTHSLGRKTVATILDEGGATAREIADQLRHARVSMTQDAYMARGRKTTRQAQILGDLDVG